MFQGALRALAAALPPDDEALDQLLAEVIAAKDEVAFRPILFAALAGGRRVEARHLVEAGALFADPGQLIAASLHCAGNAAEALVEAVARGHMGWEREATALFVAAVWCHDHPGQAVPPRLISQARLLARRAWDVPLVQLHLAALAQLLGDAGLRSVLETNGHKPDETALRGVMGACIDPVKASPLGFVPERPAPTVISGYTVRRATPRVGRNEPCPCGSGKKYKHCCYGKDRERVQHSSHVPGLTVEELRERPEVGLNEERVAAMRSYELVRLDPLKVPSHLHRVLLDRLLLFKLVEETVGAFEKIGHRNELDFLWHGAVLEATRLARKDLVMRLLKLPADGLLKLEDLSLDTRLLLASESPQELLGLVEAEADKALRSDRPTAVVDFAHSLLRSRASVLGILVARGVIATAGYFDAITLLDLLLEARDRLGLSPEDPADDILDRRFLEGPKADEATSEALETAQQGLEAKAREVRSLSAELAALRRELEKRETQQAPAPAPPKPASPAAAAEPPRPPADEHALPQLRARVETLREELKQRHNERNQLRRELQAAREEIVSLSEKAAAAAESNLSEPAQKEDHLLLAEETFCPQPVRLPEFPRKFPDTLAGLPKPVARACLALIGRLAGGEPGAFAGSQRLQRVPDVYRQRVGGDYRLLFRLHADRVEVVDLINRRDLERKIKALS
jgi:hypothetical protein